MFDKIRNTFMVIIVVCGIFLLFLRFTTPYEIKPEPPENKFIEYQQELKAHLDKYEGKNEKAKKFGKTIRATHCEFFGMACDSNFDSFSMKNFDQSYLGKLTSAISIPYMNPPASGAYYAYHTLQDVGIMPKAYAAEGLGFAGLVPFINIWKKLRDIAFLIIALAMVISGFMILFRTRMDPQNAIKLENALPKIIVAMILINFSFAIAGFMFDIMYILSGLVIVSLGPLVNPSLNFSNLLDQYLHPGATEIMYLATGSFEGGVINLLNAIWQLLYELPKALLSIFGDAIKNLIISFAGGYLFIRLFVKWGGALWAFSDGLDNIPLPGLQYLVFIIIMFISLPVVALISFNAPYLIIGGGLILTFFILILKLLIMIFQTYIKLLFYVMLSPFILLIEALPNSRAFIPWVQTIFVELLTFPALLAIFFLSGAFRYAVSNGSLMRLPFMSSAINPESIGMIVGFGTLYMMPSFIADMKKKLNTQTISAPMLGVPFFSSLSKPVGMLMKPKGLYAMSEMYKPIGGLIGRIPILDKWKSLGKP